MVVETTSVGFPTYPRVLPWNNVGIDISKAKSVDEALVLGNLDWVVKTEPAFSQLPDGSFIPAPSCRITVRTDLVDQNRVLGHVGKAFNPLQNLQAFEFCKPLVSKGLLFEKCGVLRKGRIVWMVVRLPWDAKVGSDSIAPYLVIRNAHDGSGSLEAMFLPINVTCQNVLAISPVAKPQKIRLRHTKSGENKLTSADTIFDLAQKWWDKSIDQMRELCGVPVLDGVLTEFLLLLFPEKNIRGVADTTAVSARAWVHELFVFFERGSAYDLWNAVTEYLDHISWSKGKRGSRIEARMNSLLWGAKAIKRAQAGALLLKMFN